MLKLTREQKLALKRLWEREQATVASNLQYEREQETSLPERYTSLVWPSYLAMRRKLHACDAECVMIEWRNMWLGIESDGFTHS